MIYTSKRRGIGLRLHNNGQVSEEFVAFVGIGFLMAIIVMMVIFNEQQNKFRERDISETRELAIKIEEEIIIAATVENGFARNFSLPSTLPSGKGYGIVENSSYVRIVAETSEWEVRVPKYNGSIQKGQNTICKKYGKVFIGSC
jgi:hypothetical protein